MLTMFEIRLQGKMNIAYLLDDTTAMRVFYQEYLFTAKDKV